MTNEEKTKNKNEPKKRKKAVKKKEKAGRKDKYLTHVQPRLLEVEQWARDGLIDIQIANNLGIGKDSFYTYKKKHPEFTDALKKGKEVVDMEVENSLLKNALGGYYTEDQAIKVKEVYYIEGKRCEREEVQVVEVRRYKPGETTAQIFWLKNRQPGKWKDVKQVEAEVSGKKLEDFFK